MKYLLVFFAVAILSQVQGETPGSISCRSKQCYIAFGITADFQTAFGKCKDTEGQLMTVTSRELNNIILDLFDNIKGELWIGLQFTSSGCTDVSSVLRRYNWITGDTFTDFTNWKDNSTICTPQCVSVSRDLKWTERPCKDTIDGFLCKYDVGRLCDSQNLKEGKSVHYRTPFGIEGEGALALPLGSVVTGSSSGNRYICGLEPGWIKAPWSCEVENGGCEKYCVKSPESQCTCDVGFALQSNNVTCVESDSDPCADLECEYKCAPFGKSCVCPDGFELTEDKKGCRDIDDCLDERVCKNMLCVNTNGSFECHCPSGFTEKNGYCVDIDECSLWPCEHECENTEGSYKCSCFDGYIQSSDDHNRCKLYCDKQECPAECDLNNPHQCRCPTGFITDDRQGEGIFCVDINECESNHCHKGCTNTYGSYICSCPDGYMLIKGYECVKYETGTARTPTSVTPTPGSAGTHLGITVCIVLIVLVVVFLVYQVWKRCPTWRTSNLHKSQNKDMQDLQQVIPQTITNKFVSTDLKQDT